MLSITKQISNKIMDIISSLYLGPVALLTFAGNSQSAW